jgi:chorismate mutase
MIVSQEIEKYRILIDETDIQIVRLLNIRAKYAIEIGHVKRSLDMPVYVPSREVQVLENVTANNPGPLGNEAITRLYERIIDESRRLEREFFSEQLQNDENG